MSLQLAALPLKLLLSGTMALRSSEVIVLLMELLLKPLLLLLALLAVLQLLLYTGRFQTQLLHWKTKRQKSYCCEMVKTHLLI